MRSWHWPGRTLETGGTPLTSWGNRDDGSARLPRTDSLVHTLDDLENLWDVPTGDRPRFASEIVPLLADPEPLARAAAAACLGRLGRPEAVSPLVRSLGDPSKIVWRSVAWARGDWAIRESASMRSRGPWTIRIRGAPGCDPDLRLPVSGHGHPA